MSAAASKDQKANAASSAQTKAVGGAAGSGDAKMGDAAGATAAVATKEVSPIAKFDNDYKTIPGFDGTKSVNLNYCLPSHLPDKRKVGLKLGRPAVSGTHAIVATEDPDEKEHFMIVVDTAKMKSLRADPIVGWCQPPEHVRDVRWLRDSTVVAAAGDGLIQIYSATQTAGSYELKCTVDGKAEKVHTDCVREMAPSPFSVNHIVSGGFDKTLCHLDLTRTTQRVTRRYTVSEVIGSVRWTAFKGASVVTATTDDGKLLLFDLRTAKDAPALTYSANKLDLFAHEHYTENHVLLGYADGELKHIDLRYAGGATASGSGGGSDVKELGSTQDPYVDVIGNIHYNAAADPTNNAFLVTGMTDFSVWHHGSVASKLWSHSLSTPSSLENRTNFTTGAAWLDDTTVLVANSNGYVELSVQDFK